ncbi:TlyA family RNA methyltransferase [Candidatus Saccharibacteria bacterium]|nr:MAG: TlyA family RNA methyltransferase [Candidatus Saccharibacteria bacterium]
MKRRLDVELAARGLVASRSQAESYIRLGKIKVNGRVITKAGFLAAAEDSLQISQEEQYVSRAALKLKSADDVFGIEWQGKTVLDVGSSTGGFTQYALLHGAQKVIAVDVGTDQLHPSLRNDSRIELYEKTDIRDVQKMNDIPLRKQKNSQPTTSVILNSPVDIVLADVSFISLREILPTVSKLVTSDSQLIIMVKPQFEAGQSNLKHKGVIKNDRMRRDILKEFEIWVQDKFKILDKKDSEVAGGKGNVERFYLLKKLS